MSRSRVMASRGKCAWLSTILVASAIVGWTSVPALSVPILVPIRLSIADAVSAEGMVVFTVTLSTPVQQNVTVQYQSADHTAEAGTDYTETHGTLVFAPNVLTMPISVPVANSQSEDLVFFMNLSNPTGAGLDQAVGIGTIKAANRGCGFGVGAANLIGFYALCWAGLAAIKWGRRQP